MLGSDGCWPATARNWLTQLTFDHAAVARRQLHDNYAWHQAAWDCFPGRSTNARGFLTRLDESPQGFRLLIVSPQPPTRPEWCPPEAWQSREIPPGYFQRTRYTFQLRANPTKKVINPDKPKVVRPDGRIDRNRNARRIPVRGPAELVAWLERKAAAGGFRVEADTLRVIPEGQDDFNQGRQHGVHASVEFRGTLVVTDPAKFHQAFVTGLGSANAFGFGLLVIAPLSGA
jgi:CRISPR system Cascade subunit CasE